MTTLNHAAPLLAATLLFSTALAHADVAPPPDYEETCTRAEAEADDEYCVLGNAYYADPFGCLDGTLEGLDNDPADPDACDATTSPTEGDCCQVWIDAGWSYRCKTYGASAYNTLWCRARQEGDPPRPVDDSADADEETDCSVGAPRPAGISVTLLVLLLFGLGAVIRRSRRGRRR